MAHRPVGSATSVSTSTTSAATTHFSVKSDVVRIVALGADTAVAIGTAQNPAATLADYMIVSGGEATLAVSKGSQRIIGITTGTTTLLRCPEGTNMPFSVGDRVTLEGQSNEQLYLDTIVYAEVTAVDSTTSFDGLFGTQLTVDANTAGILTAFDGIGNEATLRRAVRVATITNGGTGTVFVQQVQTSGIA
jgi:hypothetical protein